MLQKGSHCRVFDHDIEKLAVQVVDGKWLHIADHDTTSLAAEIDLYHILTYTTSSYTVIATVAIVTVIIAVPVFSIIIITDTVTMFNSLTENSEYFTAKVKWLLLLDRQT